MINENYDLEKSIVALETRGLAEIHYGDRWPLLLGSGLLMAGSGMVYEAYFVFQTTRLSLVDAHDQLSAGGTAITWALAITVPLVLAKAIHGRLKRLSPQGRARLDDWMAPLAVASITAMPLLMAGQLGIGMGNPMDLETSPSAFAETSYLAAYWMRLPVVAIGAAISGLGLLTVETALKLKTAVSRRKREVIASMDGVELLQSATLKQDTRRSRREGRRADLHLMFAQAIAIAVETKAKALLSYTNGLVEGGESFAETIGRKLKAGISDFPADVQALVGAYVPSALQSDALPTYASELDSQDHAALVKHALWLRKTFTVKKNLEKLDA